MGARKPAPEIDHPLVLSVSQIETFLLCPRKWAYQKLDEIEDPGNEASRLGGEVHDLAEDYFSKGIPVPGNSEAGRILMAGLPHLPPPMLPGLQVEEWFHVEIGPAVIRGLKDLQLLDGWKTNKPWVSDHKTTKSFQWRKEPKALLGDIQAGVYSYDAHVVTGEKLIDLQWTYMRTIGAAGAEPSCVTMDVPHMMRVYDKVAETSERIWEVKKNNSTAETVERDPTGCEAFGGCPFKDRCKPTTQERFKAIMTQEKIEQSTFISRLKARKEKKAEAESTEEPKEEPKEETKAKSSNGSSSKAMEKIRKNKAKTQEEEEPVAVNSPEGASPEPTPTKEEVKAKKATSKKKTSSKKTSSVSSAFDAFLDAVADNLAERIAEKLDK